MTEEELRITHNESVKIQEENQELKLELSGYRQAILNDKEMLGLKQENQKYKEVIDKAINNSQYWIDYYTRLNSDERIALRLQENIDILKEELKSVGNRKE